VEEKKAVVKTVDVVEELGYFELHPGTFWFIILIVIALLFGLGFGFGYLIVNVAN
jgi:hypothetical protein